jgi:CRP-like cAMP-binding protein
MTEDVMLVEETTNEILAGLNTHELKLLQGASEEIALARGQVVAEAGQVVSHLYFPLAGVLSLVGTTSGGATVEVAVVGNDGVATLSSVFGGNAIPFRVVTQVPGRALKIPTEVVGPMIEECGELHQRLLRYAGELMAQLSQSAVCNRFHNARQRLARWLLMTADRAGSNELLLTHEFISYMVGGPRSAVTEAASELRESGAIDYRRGLIIIRDNALLSSQSCECYGAAR